MVLEAMQGRCVQYLGFLNWRKVVNQTTLKFRTSMNRAFSRRPLYGQGLTHFSLTAQGTILYYIGRADIVNPELLNSCI